MSENIYGYGIVAIIILVLAALAVHLTSEYNTTPQEQDVFEFEDNDERVILISKQWDGCWLSIGEETNRLYWKCETFASPIRNLVCERNKEPPQPKQDFSCPNCYCNYE